MKKRLLFGIVLLVLIFACVGCGSEEPAKEGDPEVAVAQNGETVDENADKATEADSAAPAESSENAEAVTAEPAEEVKPEPIIEGSGTYEEITPEQAKEIIDDEEPAVILDVRSREEFAAEHIDGALNFPLEQINETTRSFIEQLIPRKDQTILVYDNDAERSKKGAQVMADIGYTNVKEFGQMDNWEYGTVTE